MAIIVIEGLLRLALPSALDVHPPGMYTTHPDVGYVLTPGFQGELVRSEFRTQISINEESLRGKALHPDGPNSFRILLLGDSQTWGFGVEDDETYAVHLEELLNRQYPDKDIQVLNGGVPGYGTADQLAFLRSRADQLQPSLVIVQFLSVNDLVENRSPASTWATVVDGRLAHRESDQSDQGAQLSWNWLSRELKTNSLLARITLDTVGYLGVRAGVLADANALWGEDFSEADAALGSELLAQIARTAESYGAQTIFLYSTGQAQVLSETYVRPRSASVVEDAAATVGVPWIDSAAALQSRSDRDKLYFAQNGHWTAAGHAAIAELLAAEIMDSHLLEPVRN